METFSALLALCGGNSPVTHEFPPQRPVTQSFDVFFDLCLNKQLSKQLRHWWFEMPLGSLWCHCNGECYYSRPSYNEIRSHFMNNLFIVIIQIQWKYNFVPIQDVLKWLLNNFAHGTTDVLLWHVQIFFSNMVPCKRVTHKKQISIKFELWWNNHCSIIIQIWWKFVFLCSCSCSWNGPLTVFWAFWAYDP